MKKRVRDFLRKGTTPVGFLVAGVILAFASLMGVVLTPDVLGPNVEMRIEPRETVTEVGSTFIVRVVVKSDVPVNVFAGEVRFDPSALEVVSIDYNTSIADLWAVKPWYENGAGTLNFAGGTTRPGGFVGEDNLITITMRTKTAGSGALALHEPRILLHDGLGTDATVQAPIDAVVTAAPLEVPSNLVRVHDEGTLITVLPEPPTTDLNGDGRHSVADISIFMLHMRGGNMKYDFDADGKVGTRDLSILMRAVQEN
jgi:hypothetical protein